MELLERPRDTEIRVWRLEQRINTDVWEGASGPSADAPGVGLQMVLGLKKMKIDEKSQKR